MQFIDVQRLVLAYRTFLHPFAVFEFIVGQVADDRREVRTEFHAEAVRIAVLYAVSVLSVDAVLVHHARLCTLGVTFPEISVISFIKFPFLPVVKFPNDCNA